MKAIMNESLTIPESVVCAGLFLVAMLVIAAALIGYFKGKEDGLNFLNKRAKVRTGGAPARASVHNL